MIAVDTNILVHAHRVDSRHNAVAFRHLNELIQGRDTWAIPWPCIHEFLAVVTSPKAFRPPTPLRHALGQVEDWIASRSLILLGETSEHQSFLWRVLEQSRVVGGTVHDARIAALCLEHGVREFWTADRDFSRFVGLITHNPLVDDYVHDHSPAYAAGVRARAAGRRRALKATQPAP